MHYGYKGEPYKNSYRVQGQRQGYVMVKPEFEMSDFTNT
jgi:hypothetical protein